MFLWFWIFLFCTFVVLLFLMFCFLFWKLQTLIETQMIKKPKRKGDIRAKLSKKEWDWNLNRVINFETIITKNFELKVIMSSALDKSNCTEVPYGKAVCTEGFYKVNREITAREFYFYQDFSPIEKGLHYKCFPVIF